LGFSYAKLGSYDEAIEAYKQATCLKPDDAKYHYNLGELYLDVGKRDSAIQEYEILKNLDRHFADKLFKVIKKRKLSR
jgi:tetratricopeptide (TPR) repeat protein